MVGQGQYELKRPADNKVVIHGESHYHDGEYDIENDLLHLNPGAEWPSDGEFPARFLQSRGVAQGGRLGRHETGQATCVANESGRERRYTASLVFPSDTYAGAALLVPIQLSLAGHKTFPIRMHLFNCAPEPRVVALEVNVNRADNQWRFYPGQQLVQDEVKPDFGFWNFLVAPVVPKVHAWFDPADGFRYVGGRIPRYLMGEEQVILASRKSVGAGKTSGSPPAAATAQLARNGANGRNLCGLQAETMSNWLRLEPNLDPAQETCTKCSQSLAATCLKLLVPGLGLGAQ